MAERWVLGFAIAGTAIGLLRVGVWPVDAPLPQPVPAALLHQLRAQGWQLGADIAAEQRRDVSNAAGQELGRPASASALGGAVPVQLSLIPVRARTYDQLGAATLGRVITGRAFSKPAALRFDADQFLRVQEGKQPLAISCIAAGQARTSQEDLAQVLGRPPTALSERFKIALGLQPPRNWSCLFVAIRVPDGPNADQVIKGAWAQVRPVLITGWR